MLRRSVPVLIVVSFAFAVWPAKAQGDDTEDAIKRLSDVAKSQKQSQSPSGNRGSDSGPPPPSNAEMRRDAAVAQGIAAESSFLAGNAAFQSDLDLAIENYKDALKKYTKLSQAYPRNQDLQARVRQAYRGLAHAENAQAAKAGKSLRYGKIGTAKAVLRLYDDALAHARLGQDPEGSKIFESKQQFQKWTKWWCAQHPIIQWRELQPGFRDERLSKPDPQVVVLHEAICSE